jgi:hypothetical protein
MVSERQRRVAVMRQFELQMPKYPLKILERLTNFRYRMIEEQRGVEMLATVLASSFDFYEHRLNLAKHGFTLIVCQKHNAAVPVFTLELDTQVMYEPGTTPDRRFVPEGKQKHRTPDEQKILISQIIIGASAGMTELKDMPDRTRQRYLVLREQYLQPKVGRPWAS